VKELRGKHIVFIVENNSVPFDRRVWREALALKDNGFIVSIIAPKSGVDFKNFEIIENVAIYRYNQKFSDGSKISYLSEYFRALLKSFYILNKLMIKKRIFVVHVANPPDIFWLVAIYCKLLNIKFIFDEHDLTPETYLSLYSVNEENAGIFYKILKIFQLLSYRFSDAIISTNESYKKIAIKKNKRNKNKTFIVRNGPDTRWFKPVAPNIKLKRGKTHLFAYIGIMAYQDGVEYIINAVEYLVFNKKYCNFIIYLIGKGSDLERLKLLVKEKKIEDYIIFTGRIPDEPALEILSTADICLSPDPYNPLNNFSTMNKVMEYMALGKPIVSFDLLEARFSAKDAAYYVENNSAAAFGEGILYLINHPEQSKEMGEKGKKRIEESLSWEKQINSLLNVYNFVLKK